MACLRPGPEDLEYWLAECPLSGPDGSAILLHPAESQDSGCPGKGSSWKLRQTMKAWSLETACCPESLPMGPPSAYLGHSLSFNYQWPKSKSNWPEFLHQFLKKLGIKLPHDPTGPRLGIYPEQITIEKDSCTPVPTAAAFTPARTGKQPRCPLTDGWSRSHHTHTQWHSTQL